MTEARITAELIQYLRSSLPGVYVKHADRSTIGLPDLSATTMGHTTWFEVKVLRVKPTDTEWTCRAKDYNQQQLAIADLLDYHGKCWYLNFVHRGKEWWLFPIPAREVRTNRQTYVFPLGIVNSGKRFDRVLDILKRRFS